MSEHEAPEVTMQHVDAARAVLTHLGYAVAPSREPGADARADAVAGVLARCLQPNAEAQRTARALGD